MSTQPTAVVTGASSGFGRQTAQLLAADGWQVYASMRDTSGRNAAVAGQLREAGLSVLELDVTNDASVEAAAALVLREAGAPDLVVNNAGTGFFGLTEAFTVDAVERQYATNVFGPLRVNRAFLPAMRERRAGLVVYVSSVVGRVLYPYGGVYASTKWALEALAETAAYELAPFGIDVAIVQPGAYPTEIFGKVTGPDDPDRVADYGAQSAEYNEKIIEGLSAAAQGRDPADVARAIVALANAPAGNRPLRVTVPANETVDAINAAVAPLQTGMLRQIGLDALLPKALA